MTGSPTIRSTSITTNWDSRYKLGTLAIPLRGHCGTGNLSSTCNVRGKVNLLRKVVPVFAVAVLATACGQTGPGSGVGGPAPLVRPARSNGLAPAASDRRCSSTNIHSVAGASPALGLTSAAGASPVWSGRTGWIAATSETESFSVENGCVLAFTVSDGQQQWSWSDQKHPYVGGAIADNAIAVVATGNDVGTGPADAYPVVDHLVGLDAATGRELWSRPLANDGQSIPAVFAGADVVVSLADGAVLAIDPTTGATAWSDPAPASCHLGPPNGPSVDAAVVAGGPSATVEYNCLTGVDHVNNNDNMVAELNPANGTMEWSWQPGGLSLEYQSSVASSDGVIAVVDAGGSGSEVPGTEWGLGPTGYQTYEVVGIDQTDGRPLWKLTTVPTDAAVYAGPAQLCVVSQFGVSCRAARTGAQTWEWRPVVVPASGAMPMMGNAPADDGGILYLIAPTVAAARIDTGSTTQRSGPGIFRLVAVNLAGGAVTLSIPLPAFYGGPDGVVVSLISPPGVEAVSDGTVIISPQFHETDITEAFKVG